MEIYKLYEEAKKFVEYIENNEDAQTILNVERCNFDAIDKDKLDNVEYMMKLIIEESGNVYDHANHIKELVLNDFLSTLSVDVLRHIAEDQFEKDPKRSMETLFEICKDM